MVVTNEKAEECKGKAEIVAAAVGKNYEKYYGDGTDTPWLDDDPILQQQLKKNQWIRWDGAIGTAQEHMHWMKAQAQSFISEERHGEYRPYGERKGVQYYIHDAMTQQGKGYGFFKLVGTFDFEPKDLVACMFDFRNTADMDKTVVQMKLLGTFYQNEAEKGKQQTKSSHNPFVTATYWCNAPGFPFYYRDGLDLSGYLRDDGNDGIMWQLSTSIREGEFQSNPYAVAAQDRYWAYKLEPIVEQGKPRTKVTLICQTILNGCIPKSISNYVICNVLIDYMSSTEDAIKKNKENGNHDELLKRLQLHNV